MKTWISALALGIAVTVAAAPVLAQGAAGGTGSPGAGSSSSPSSSGSSPSSTGADIKSSSPSSTPPAASPSDTKSPDSMKSSDDSTKMDGKHASRRTHGGGSANAEQVKAVQQALKDKGHDPGDVDGKMGPKTQAALRDYQQKEGLKATGRLDAETASKLGVEAKTSGASSSSPAASPSTSAPSKSDSSMKSDSSSSTDTSAKPSKQQK